MTATVKDNGRRVRAQLLAFLPGLPHDPTNVLVVYVLEGTLQLKAARLSELEPVMVPS